MESRKRGNISPLPKRARRGRAAIDPHVRGSSSRAQVTRLGIVRESQPGFISEADVRGLDSSFPPIVPPPISLRNEGGKIASDSLPVQLIFWGAAWNDPATSPSIQALTDSIRKVLAGPYTTALRQYGVRPPYFGDFLVVTDPGPPTLPHQFSESDVNDLIWDLIDNGTFPEPDEEGGLKLYCAMMPPNTSYAPGGAAGAHSPARDVDIGLGGVDVDYAWVAWVGNYSLDNMTSVFSHELVEMCSDPEGDAWKVDGQPEQLDEIGDVCAWLGASLNGVRVQSYWSMEDSVCLIPTAYSLRRTLKWAGITLGGNGIRSLQGPVPSLVSLLRSL